MTYNPRDSFFLKAKKENYKARSVYKLQEIDEKHHLLKPNQLVLDLGAAPGSWTQYCSKKIGKQGLVLAVDLQKIDLKLANVQIFEMDLRELDIPKVLSELNTDKVDIVLSDMAPQTTGIKDVDQARSFDLCELALQTSDLYLKQGGSFVIKFFHSEQFADLKKRMTQKFKEFYALRPESTRQSSKEIFLIGKGKK